MTRSGARECPARAWRAPLETADIFGLPPMQELAARSIGVFELMVPASVKAETSPAQDQERGNRSSRTAGKRKNH